MTPTREQVIEMAKEAGFVSAQFWPDDYKGLFASVERFAALVHAAARAQALEDAANRADTEGITGISSEDDEIVANWLRAMKGKQ